MEASLFGPVEEESEPSPTPEEENALLAGWRWTLSSFRSCSPTSRNPQVQRICRAAYHSSYFHLTPICPSVKRKTVGKDWCWPIHPWPVGSSIFEGGWLSPRMVGRFLPPCPLYRWVLWHPSPEASPPTSCCFPAASHIEESAWYMGSPTLPVSTGEMSMPQAQGLLNNSGLLGGVERGNCSAGCCAPEVCHSGWGSPSCILWSGAGAPQVLGFGGEGGWLVWSGEGNPGRNRKGPHKCQRFEGPR